MTDGLSVQAAASLKKLIDALQNFILLFPDIFNLCFKDRAAFIHAAGDLIHIVAQVSDLTDDFVSGL